MKLPLFFEKKDDTILVDQYSESDYGASNADAHRDMSYETPSFLKQMWISFQTQLRLYGKGSFLVVLLVLVLLIPIIVYSGVLDVVIDSILENILNSGKGYAALLLSALPFMISWIVPAILAGSLPSEFKERTAYLNFALPQSRLSFYLGKFLAGFAVVLAVFIFAFAVVMIMAGFKYDFHLDPGAMGSLIGLTVAELFAFSAMAYMLGLFLKKRGVLITMVLWFIFLPLLVLGLSVKFDGLMDIAICLPFFNADLGLLCLEPHTGMAISVLGMFKSLFDIALPAAILPALAGIAWGAAFLFAGYYFFERRQI